MLGTFFSHFEVIFSFGVISGDRADFGSIKGSPNFPKPIPFGDLVGAVLGSNMTPQIEQFLEAFSADDLQKT